MDKTHLDRLVGQLVVLDENDYMYGIGLLRLRLRRVTELRSEPGWALVAGTMVDFRGGEHAEREVVVRVGALLEGVQ